MRIQVASCKQGYQVWIIEDPELYGVGNTVKDAIENLMNKYPIVFNDPFNVQQYLIIHLIEIKLNRKMKLQVTTHELGYKVFISDTTFGIGSSIKEAIGHFVLKYPELFHISIELDNKVLCVPFSDYGLYYDKFSDEFKIYV